MLDESPEPALTSRFVAMIVSAAVVVATAGCARPDTPAVPSNADTQLVEGRDIYINKCASCHGGAGGGGRGTKLAGGKVIETYPNFDDNIDHVTNGRNAMPAFSGQLTADQIEGVVRYVREVLTLAPAG